jgi:hypothetical protein
VQARLDEHNAARAAAIAKHAENELAQCAYVAEGDAERSALFQNLQADAAALWAYCERLRRNVYCQTMCNEGVASLPDGKVVVTAIAYTMPEKDYMLDFESV